jgi:acetamidase/formamidase
LDTEALRYEIDRGIPALALVESGAQITVETEDAFSGQIRVVGDRRDREAEPRSNPATGPIAVVGAQPGDALRIEIERIEPLAGQCATYLWPYPYLTAELGWEGDSQTRICAIHDTQIEWSPTLQIPYAPMIGVIGVAPAWGVPTTDEVGPHGGNLDLCEICPGTTLWLPVLVPGGMVYVGDCHAAQGHGELAGAALEMSARVTLTVHLERARRIAAPRFATPEMLGAVAVRAELSEAVVAAYAHLALWLESDFEIGRFEATSLLTQVGRISVGYVRAGVAAALIPRRLLGTKDSV